jgi:hypothetical protein
VAPDRVVEAELPGVAELEDADAREELRDRADAVDRPRVRRHPASGVCEAEAPAPDHLLVVDDAGRDTRDLIVRPLRVEPDAHQLEGLRDPRVVRETPIIDRTSRRLGLAARQRRRLGLKGKGGGEGCQHGE